MFKYSKYIDVDSIIHTLNPTFKLLITICYIISVFLAKSLLAYLFLLTFLLIILIFSFISDICYYKYIFNYKYLILAIVVLDLLISWSFKSAILVLLSTIFSILILGAFVFTTKPKDILVTLEMIFLPFQIFGVNPKRLAFKIMSLTIYKPIFEKNKKDLDKELKNRDLNLKFFDKIKLIHKNTINEINRLNETMITRNYFVYKRDIYKQKIKSNDCLFTLTQLVLLIAIIVKG